MKTKRVIFPILILFIFLSGCSDSGISQSDYDAVNSELANSRRVISNQEKKIEELSSEKANLEEQISILEDQIRALQADPDVTSEESTSESFEESKPVETPVPTDENVIPLGNSCVVTIKPHPVRNSSSSKTLFTIGLGEADSEVVSSISSDDLNVFIEGTRKLTEFNIIVLCFEDGTGIVFNNSTSSFTNDYGFIDVSSGNFEITERLGAILKQDGKWVYMTEEEMIAADESDW